MASGSRAGVGGKKNHSHDCEKARREDIMYAVKRGDQQYNAQDLNVLQQWASAGSILPTDLVYDPQSNQWVQADQFPAIKDILAQKAGAAAGTRQAQADLIAVSTEDVPGREIESVLGLVQGSTVRAKHFGKDFLAGFKNLVGGEVSEYTEMLNEARKIATDRMIQHAASVGANAVVNIRYTTSSVAQGMAEILAYGTAVKLRPKEG